MSTYKQPVSVLGTLQNTSEEHQSALLLFSMSLKNKSFYILAVQRFFRIWGRYFEEITPRLEVTGQKRSANIFGLYCIKRHGCKKSWYVDTPDFPPSTVWEHNFFHFWPLKRGFILILLLCNFSFSVFNRTR